MGTPLRFLLVVITAVFSPLTCAQAENVAAISSAAKPISSKEDARVLPALSMLLSLNTQHRYADLLALSAQFPASVRSHHTIQRLEGTALAALGRTDEAILKLESALVQNPKSAGLRLDLAQLYATTGQKQSARSQLEAIATNSETLPEIRELSRRGLRALNYKTGWGASASFAIAPDTNINSSTDSTTIDIFGIPFKLNDNARKKSGIGADTRLTIVYTPNQKRPIDFTGFLDTSLTDYQHASFDQAQIRGYGGISLRAGPRARLTFEALTENIWFGGDHYSEAYGISTRMVGAISPKLFLTVQTQARKIDYIQNNAKDGPYGSVLTALTHRNSKGHETSLQLAIDRAWAEANSEKFLRAGLSVSHTRYIIPNLRFSIEPSVALRNHDERSVGFASKRQDISASISARVMWEKLRFRNYAPYISARASRNWSEIELYDFERARIEFGVARVF